MFLSTDPAASTSISGSYTYASANPLRYIDITGLFSWDEALGGIQDISGIVSDVAGVLAIVAAATGVGAPVAAVFGGISIAAGAVHAGTKAIQAYNTCTTGKGSCGDAVAQALLSAGTIPPGAKLIKGAASGIKAVFGASKAAKPAASRMDRAGSALKDDLHHRSVSWVVDDPAAKRFKIRGDDRMKRELHQLNGELNDKPGIFEWIIDRNGDNPLITHQRFIPGGSITGFPNQMP